MRIAVTAMGDSIEDQMSFRLGRCAYYLVIDTDTNEVEPIENPDRSGTDEVSTVCATLLSNRQIRAVVTGHCGPEAHRVFGDNGIKVYPGMTGPVEDVVEKMKKMNGTVPDVFPVTKPKRTRSAVTTPGTKTVEKVVFPSVNQPTSVPPRTRTKKDDSVLAKPRPAKAPTTPRRMVEIEPAKELRIIRAELGVMGKKMKDMQARLEMLERLFQ